jgi:hypothetical protein
MDIVAAVAIGFIGIGLIIFNKNFAEMSKRASVNTFNIDSSKMTLIWRVLSVVLGIAAIVLVAAGILFK